jgi:hypothetical protein
MPRKTEMPLDHLVMITALGKKTGVVCKSEKDARKLFKKLKRKLKAI